MVTNVFELYLIPGQDVGQVTGFDIAKHLEETGLINRAFSLEDELIKGWIADPSTYPEELKTKEVFLWKSQRHPSYPLNQDNVSHLSWCGGPKVLTGNQFLNRWWSSRGPAILKPKEV